MRKVALFILIIALVACEGKKPAEPKTETQPKAKVIVPNFNADSAYAFVKAQTDFGPRVPLSAAHEQCCDWMVEKLSEYADTVMVQQGKE
jgi:hypothetical protein